MNHVAEEILMHYGVSKYDGAPGPGSGRYPAGSGENPNQHRGDFLSRVEEMRRQGFTYTDEKGKTWTGDTAIAKSMGLSSNQFRVQIGLAREEKRSVLADQAERLREKGYSLNEIAKEMGYSNDSSVRSLLNANAKARMLQVRETADALKKVIAEKGMIDVGVGIEKELNISKEKFNQALALLETEGYPVYKGKVEQQTNPGKWTTMRVLCPQGTEYKEIYNWENVHTLNDYISRDDGKTLEPKFIYPSSMDSKRLAICYGDEGGKDKDGLIELRRGVEDLDLGESHYAQVRILVDGTHYIKGMAVYADDLPDGVDVRFNTNKPAGTPALGPKDKSVLKPIGSDPNNPFGSLIKEGIVDPDDPTTKGGGQSWYIDKNGNKKLSLINKRAEEGDWNEWKDKLPSQFLSKQPLSLVKKQLGLAAADKVEELDEIKALTNPTVKRLLLSSYADDCDAAAVHLQAAALPRQKFKVIVPVPSLKDNEVYAPTLKSGETVALIRYPHGGTFEIPILKVNNRQPDAKSVLENAIDAIGINSKVAAQLSGADFDGDTVMVVPCNSPTSKVKIKAKPPLKGLEDFDPKLEYGGRPEGSFKRMKDTQKEMGVISNLITDMTVLGAKEDELARAVRHSMVVIDAEKHGLDYKASERDNGIAALKRRYQGRIEDGRYHEGAATLISQAKSETSVVKRQGTPKINQKGKSWYDPDQPEGALIYKEVREEYTDKNGKTHVRTQRSTKMAEAKDAYSLISEADYPVERAYANYANKMKSLANDARKELVYTGKLKQNPSAKTKYASETKRLDSALNVAELNAPRERQAQLKAKVTVSSTLSAMRKDNPSISKAEERAISKKVGQRALTEARAAYGASGRDTRIKISDREWEAIQAGAVSDSKLTRILKYTDMDSIKERATPRARTELSSAKISKIKAMQNSGYTIADIADAVGVSSSTVTKYLK